jgi:hypothetical protein
MANRRPATNSSSYLLDPLFLGYTALFLEPIYPLHLIRWKINPVAVFAVVHYHRTLPPKADPVFSP